MSDIKLFAAVTKISKLLRLAQSKLIFKGETSNTTLSVESNKRLLHSGRLELCSEVLDWGPNA